MIELTELEWSSGYVLGVHPDAPPLVPDPGTTPRAAFDEVVRRALERQPCGITFSGGRDSSAVLAAAVAMARAEGYPLPVPITIRWRDVPEADERDWQEQVVAHLGLTEWIIEDLGSELDLVGPVATEVLERLGPYYPTHYHAFAYLARHVAGGSLVTGHGGDSLLAAWRWRNVYHGGDGALRRILQAGHALSPLPVRRALANRRAPEGATWLAEDLRRQFAAQAATERAREPRRWDDRLDWLRRRRTTLLSNQTLREMGSLHDVEIRDPFFDRGFLAALAAQAPLRGPGDRTAVMRSVFADVLPDELLARSSKAHMTRGYVTEHTRDFIDRWDGTGFDPDVVVDPEALRAAWRLEEPVGIVPLQVAYARSR